MIKAICYALCAAAIVVTSGPVLAETTAPTKTTGNYSPLNSARPKLQA